MCAPTAASLPVSPHQDLEPFRRHFRVVTKEDLLAPVFNILSVGREERAVIDMFLARDADIFIGHFSSTFSTVRAETHKRAPRAATIYRRRLWLIGSRGCALPIITLLPCEAKPISHPLSFPRFRLPSHYSRHRISA